jgi:curved DNA-binding protein CbpA
MNKVHAAYQKLGAHPGADFESMKRRYKVLVLVWHPDRMTTDAGRQIAEEELKQINNAFECIKKHFESGHSQGPGCECQPAAFNQQSGACQNQNTGYGASGGNAHQRERTTYEKWAEQEAREEAERRRRAEEAHEAALKESLETARRAAEAQQSAATAAAKAKVLAANPPCTEQQLRWHIATGLAVIFAFLLIGGFNKRYEPKSNPNSEFSLAEHSLPSPF